VKLKRTVTIEFDCVKITSARCFGQLLWCEFCQKQTKFLTPAEVSEIAELVGVHLAADERNLHFYQPPAAPRLICLKSILDCEQPD